MTPKMQQCFDFIHTAAEGGGVCPSYREIQKHMGLSSVSHAHALVGNLEERGYVYRTKGLARSIEIVYDREEFLTLRKELSIAHGEIARLKSLRS